MEGRVILPAAVVVGWSSARAHVEGEDDKLVKVQPLLERVGDWKSFLRTPEEKGTQEQLRLHERTGRPLGSARFIKRLERLLGRPLRPQKRGPKRGEEKGRSDETPRPIAQKRSLAM